MKEKLIAFVQMTRLKESLPVLVFSGLLGVASTKAALNWNVIWVLLANLLVSCAGFIFHALQFAPLDMLNAEGRQTNPIAAGVIAARSATILSLCFGFIALVLYAMLGIKALLAALALFTVLTLLNWRKLGLQRFFYLKPGVYQWLINGFFCLMGSLVQNAAPSQTTLTAIVLLVMGLLFISFNDESRKATSQTSQRVLSIAALVSLILTVLIGGILFIMLNLLPVWVIALFFVLSAILLLPQALERQREGQKPLFAPKTMRVALFRAAAISLAVHFITPFLYQLFK